jgi:hypothetical protein
MLAAPLLGLSLLFVGSLLGDAPAAQAAPGYCNIARADVNGDGTVNITDLAAVAARFLTQEGPPYDQNDDNQINIADLSIVAGHFLKSTSTCPEPQAIVDPANIVIGQTQSTSASVLYFPPRTELNLTISAFGFDFGPIATGIITDNNGSVSSGTVTLPTAQEYCQVVLQYLPSGLPAFGPIPVTAVITAGSASASVQINLSAPACPL